MTVAHDTRLDVCVAATGGGERCFERCVGRNPRRTARKPRRSQGQRVNRASSDHGVDHRVCVRRGGIRFGRVSHSHVSPVDLRKGIVAPARAADEVND